MNKMNKFNAKDKQIFDDMKQCVKDLGLKIVDEYVEEGVLLGMSTFEYPGYNLGIFFSYTPSTNMASVVLGYADIPVEKLPALYDLLNRINGHLIGNHFYINPELRILLMHSGMEVTGYFLDKAAFMGILGHDLGSGHTFMPLIVKVLASDQTPQAVMEEFMKQKHKMPRTLFMQDWTRRVKQKAEDLPFFIHVYKDMPAFPTHTHGLTELGMPEFLMDPLSFGQKGTYTLVIVSYNYFSCPENKAKLEAIMNGKIVKLTHRDLAPDGCGEGPYVYCYRRVYPEFEMVRQAYNIDEEKEQSDASPEVCFVQIYVEGDDHVLTDDYYKGGVMW